MLRWDAAGGRADAFMFGDYSLQFEQPLWLLLIALVLPAYAVARRSIGGLSALKTHVTFGLRAIVITLLAMALAKPLWLKAGEGVTVMVILDRSRSIPYALQEEVLDYLRAATDPDENVGRTSSDRLGIISAGGNAAIAGLPNEFTTFDNFADNLSSRDATNLADGLSLALASAPHDTAIRFVLVTDGNETTGSVTEAARRVAANDIPIDVLPITYTLPREVKIDRVVSPARARQGQVHTLRVVLRAQSASSGTLTITQNGEPIDISPGEPGEGALITLQPGLNTQQVPIVFDQAGPQQFKATFEADDPASDVIAENNSAGAVTFVGGEGRVLIVAGSSAEAAPLESALSASDLSVEVNSPSAIDSLVTLAGYDAVILLNQPFSTMSDDQDRWLHDYVHDLGGGLVMIGGPDSFGAGGWIDTYVEQAMPVEFDPPQRMQRQRGALALVMHSSEMAQANFWGLKIAESAINALSSLDVVGIVDYNWTANGSVWEWGPDLAGDKSGVLAAARAMPVGDMPDFGPSLKLVVEGLSKWNAKRHAIIISDGDPAPPSPATVRDLVNNQITVTTIRVAGHGGPQTMQNIAASTGGTFYDVTNPRNLPEIIISETRMIARSLVVEDQIYVPRVQNELAEPIRGFTDLPAVDGYVLTAPKAGLAQIPFIDDVNGDPIYANWNYGIGKAIAFTPDLSGRWGARWIAWDDLRGFWDQSIRWVMRPVTPSNLTVNTRIDGDRAIVEIEVLESDETFQNFLSPSAAVLGPEGTSALSIRQVGPGRYRGEFPVEQAGSYLVNTNFRDGDELVGNIQAAVNVPYAREFETVKDDRAKALEIAELTGGRNLAELGVNPIFADLWNEEGLVKRRSHRPIWDLLAVLAACLFIFDVAARRLSVGLDDIRKRVGKLVGRRGAAREDAVAAWKRARSQVAHSRERQDTSKDEQRADRTTKFEADESTEGQSFDVGQATSDTSTTQSQTQPRRRDQTTNAPDEEEGDFTSRLLAAKRRAREQRKADPQEGAGDSDA